MKLPALPLTALPLSAVLLVSVVSPACTGTETGNPVDGSGLGDEVIELPGEGPDECEEVATEIGWDDSMQLGLSAEQVATALASGTTENILWRDVAGLSLPEASEGTITVKVSPRLPVLAVTPVPKAGNDGPVAEGPVDEPTTDGPVTGGVAAEDLPSVTGPTCGSKLRIAAFVEIESSEGQLDERFVTTIDAQTPEAARIHVQVPKDALRGSLRGAGDFDALEIELLLTPVGIKGSLSVVDEAESANASVLGTLAANTECPGTESGFLLEGNDSLNGLSPNGLHDLFAKAGAAEWTLEHEEGMLAVTSRVALDDSLCVSANIGLVEFLTTVHLEATDGSLNGSFPVNVHVQTDSVAGTLAAQMAGGKYLQELNGEEEGLGEEYGITDPAPLDGYVGAMTDFVVDVTAQPWGIFRYAGLTPDPCTTPEDGCQGMIPTTLFGMHLGEPKGGYALE
jgi:hypothetical protein